MRVVDQLEAVQVKEYQAQRQPQAAAPLQLPAQNLVKVTHVVEAGRVIGDGQLLNPGHVARVLDGDGGVIGQNVQEGDGIVGDLIGARVEDLDGAVRSLASAQRKGDDRAYRSRLGSTRRRNPRIVLGLGNQQRLAVLDHPACHPLAQLHALVAQRGIFPSGCNRIIKILPHIVQHQQRPQLGIDKPFHVLDDGAQDRVQVETRGQ